jgi:hypothetical protein
MSIVSAKDLQFQENLTHLMGNSAHAQELKQILLMAKKGQITDEAIRQYKEQKEAELEEYRKIFTEVNPSYAFDYLKETPFIPVAKMTEECIEDQPSNVLISESGERGNVASER